MFSYEHRLKPILSPQKFYKRLLKNFLLAMIILFISISIGIIPPLSFPARSMNLRRNYTAGTCA